MQPGLAWPGRHACAGGRDRWRIMMWHACVVPSMQVRVWDLVEKRCLHELKVRPPSGPLGRGGGGLKHTAAVQDCCVVHLRGRPERWPDCTTLPLPFPPLHTCVRTAQCFGCGHPDAGADAWDAWDAALPSMHMALTAYACAMCAPCHGMAPQAHFSAVTCLALSPDGWLLLSGGRDKVVVVWDLRK